MKLIDAAIAFPKTVAVGVLASFIAGLLVFSNLPVRMTPEVDSIFITVETFWESATPEQIESEVISQQEKALGNLANLVEMSSTSLFNLGSVSLEFAAGTDVNKVLHIVLQKLDEIPGYPEGVDQPVVKPFNPMQVNLIAWAALASEDPNFDTTIFYDLMQRRMQPVLERVKGITKIDLIGARERELQLKVDADAMASYGITYTDLIEVLQRNNQAYSGGLIPDGKHNVLIQMAGRYNDPDSIEGIVVKKTETGLVRLGDFIEAAVGYKEPVNWVRIRGKKMPLFSFQLESGGNLLETMAELDAVIADMNSEGGMLERAARQMGLTHDLELVKTYDTSIYVENAVNLIERNILVGGALAAITLLLFLRSFRVIGIISIAIPISVVASVVVIVLLGRSVNIVSLAGMAFAVGMVIDNAIVVIENIHRHLEAGLRPVAAARKGSQEVAPAVLASTATTIVVFIPILFIQESAGQLFKDISLAIMAAVAISFLVSIIVIPALAANLVRAGDLTTGKSSFDRLHAFVNKVPKYAARLVSRLIASTGRKLLVVAIFASVTVGGIALLAPPLDYLPSGNFNAAIGVLIPPPGYNLSKMEEIGGQMETQLRPAWFAGGPKFQSEQEEITDQLQQQDLGTLTVGEDTVAVPAINEYMLVAWEGQMFQYSMPVDDSKTVDVVELLKQSVQNAKVTDVLNFAFQLPLFNTGGNTGSAIAINVRGDDLALINRSALLITEKIAEVFGPYQVVPVPANYLMPTPELRIIPDDDKMALSNIDRRDLGLAIAANGDGIVLPRSLEIGGDLKDIKIVTQRSLQPNAVDALLRSPVALPEGGVADISNVAKILKVRSPDVIRHVERLRAVTLQFTPPAGEPIEHALKTLNVLIAELVAQGKLSPLVDISMTGSAGKLSDMKRALVGDGSLSGLVVSSLFLALAVVYLVMVVLFQNWFYPVVIIITVPLATLGGFLGLAAVHYVSVVDRYQPIQNMDVLTILGFVILAGVVVNNAILIMYQTINNLKDGAVDAQDAIVQAVSTRVRPILMSTLTSVGGMLPLVLMPGAGSELYRGVGAVVVSGLLVATVFTIILVPVILSLVFSTNYKMSKTSGQEVPDLSVADTN